MAQGGILKDVPMQCRTMTVVELLLNTNGLFPPLECEKY